MKDIKILFVAGFGTIAKDVEMNKKLYADDFGIEFKSEENGYLHTDKLDGVKHFAIWPLSEAAKSFFGTDKWPSDFGVPQAWLELEVENIDKATAELKSQGYKLLVSNKKEPWGQTVTRFLDPNGLLVGITHTPWMRS